MPETLRPVGFAEISGWAQDDHDAAFAAFQLSATGIITKGHGFQRPAYFGGQREDWLDICSAALKARTARPFFEEHFQAFRVSDAENPQGLFTGYYEPEAEGRLQPDQRFCVPLYGKPDDLEAFTPEEVQASGLSYGRRVDGRPAPYPDRRAIEGGALAGRGLELCWIESWVDAFFMHVQGSARIMLPGGKALRLSYAAKNGRPYTGIGATLLARGIGTRATMSMQFLRHWMAEHAREARELLWCNQSFVFFRSVPVADGKLGAIGAGKVHLTPLRSLAVDRRHWMFGTPLFVDTQLPPESNEGAAPFQKLMIAQDTGTAIKGLVRGDVYWGWGPDAAHLAGHMKSPGRLVALLPKAVAAKLSP